MGNYNCCGQKNQDKKSIRIKSIRTTSSFVSHYRSDIFQKKVLLPQFIQDFSQALQSLHKNRSYFQLSPPCFNVTITSKIGKGAHSDVYLIKTDYQTNFMQMALKIIPKQKLKSDSLKKSNAMQNLLLLYNTSPFLMKSYMSRQDQHNIYFFGPIAPGGDLVNLAEQLCGKALGATNNEEQNVRFIIAGIILGLEYLHNFGIILNDLKLQNILIDKDGYPIITDFGLIQPQNVNYFQQIVGTIAYFSPQKLFNSQYSRAVDFWALGVLIYCLVYHEYPFDRQVIQCGNFLNQILAKQNKHKRMSPKGSQQLKDLINNLLLQNPDDRLGVENINDLKSHKFFRSLDWKKYENKSLKSPFAQIIQRNPLKHLNQNDLAFKMKNFRNQPLQDEYLFAFDQTLKLKKSLCSTADRRSNQENSQYLQYSPLYKTTTLSSFKDIKKPRKKSVSFSFQAGI